MLGSRRSESGHSQVADVDVSEGRGRKRVVVTFLLPLLVLGTGCSAGRGSLHPPRSWHRKYPPGSDPSTIGTDFRKVPPGRTIPPAGLGVDLVQGESDAKRDASATTASAWQTTRTQARD
jgi:hypothetical protein